MGFLTQFGNSVHVPWLVPGDFNSVEMIILMFLPMKLETSCVVVWIWGFLILTVQVTTTLGQIILFGLRLIV